MLFNPEICSGCGLCVAVCPVRAMAVSLEEHLELMAAAV
ncbi:MAG: 4Fe-4S binding protein [Desulfobulbaceae bacterium]|nr:4Fe-4S binding protein [Desulfobulbaceae bacterium]